MRHNVLQDLRCIAFEGAGYKSLHLHMGDDVVVVNNPVLISNANRYNFSVRSNDNLSYKSRYIIEDGELRCGKVVAFNLNDEATTYNLVEMEQLGLDTSNSSEAAYDILYQNHLFDLGTLLLFEQQYAANISTLNRIARTYSATSSSTKEDMSTDDTKEISQEKKEVQCVSYTRLNPAPDAKLYPDEVLTDLESIKEQLRGLRATLTKIRCYSRINSYTLEELSPFVDLTKVWTPLKPLPRSKKKQYQETQICGNTLRRTEWTDTILK